jgi:hypothetical protein
MQLVIHTDSSPYHTANVVLDFVSQRKIRFAPHPPNSPDIAPSDFSFWWLKPRAARLSFSDQWGASCWDTKIGGRDLSWNFVGHFSRLDFMVRKSDRKWWELLWINDQRMVFILHNSAQWARYYARGGTPCTLVRGNYFDFKTESLLNPQFRKSLEAVFGGVPRTDRQTRHLKWCRTFKCVFMPFWLLSITSLWIFWVAQWCAAKISWIGIAIRRIAETWDMREICRKISER